MFNGFKICCLFLIITFGNCLPDGDLCKWMNGRKYYIDIGESGSISVENATSLTAQEAGQSGNNQPQVPQRCSVELITCPACHLEITIQKMAIPNCSNDKTCRCDFVWIKESAYSKSGREYCGFKANDSEDLVYESKTKLVSIDFLYSGSYNEAFVLQFRAKKNIYMYKGSYDFYNQMNSSGVIKSPNFPGGYPSDYSAEFIMQNVDSTGFVQLIFTDFQLSLWSFAEIFDSNGTRIDVYNGNTFRPPAIMSSGPTLTVKFQANDEYPSTGFQAKYTFVSYPEKYWINRPSTDCGGFVEDLGGAITMMNIVPTGSLQAFDCIWIIRPLNSHIPETQVSIRVAQFEELGPKSTLTIRQGQHSDAPLLESVTTYHHPKVPRGQEFVVPAISGFYIRMMGYFSNKSHLAIIYTTFRYEGCYGSSDFECDNGRCIKTKKLCCDGFNHCGDGSDEASCYGTKIDTPSPEDTNWWRTLTPNYYFPKPESSPGAGTNTLILVSSMAGLGMFVLTTVMILVKLHRQRNDDTISQEILRTISGDLDMDNSPSHHSVSDLPLYDPPPSYEDVIKLYLPPPPPYSSVPRGRSQQRRFRGVENHAYRNDGQNESARIHTRRQRTPHRGESNAPMILQVSLPEEPSSPVRNCTNVQKSYAEGSSVSRSEAISSTSRNDAIQFCNCQGACSCQISAKKKQVSRSSSENKPSSKNNVMSVYKKRSFKDLISSSDGLKTHTSKKHESRSEGPSSPTEKNMPGLSDPNVKLGHRRTTSGPIDVSASLSCISDKPCGGSDISGQKFTSENQIPLDVPSVKHLASILLDGLQQSFNFKSEENLKSQLREEEKSIWANILTPSWKCGSNSGSLCEAGNNRMCDTLPLLSDELQKLLIVKNYDDSSPQHKSKASDRGEDKSNK